MSSTAFKTEDYADFRLNLALKRVGQEILSSILEIAIQKPKDQPYYEYLSSKEHFNRKSFAPSQKQKLQNPSAEQFDISILYKIFIHSGVVVPTSDEKWRCPDTFEYNLKKIKDLRNDVVHDASPIPYTDLDRRMNDIKDVLTNIVNISSIQFNIELSSVDKMLMQIKQNIENILTTPLSQTDIDEYLLTEGVFEAKFRYRKLSFVNPVDFFVGVEFNAKIDDVFVALEIKDLSGYDEGQRIEVKHLLKPFDADTSLIAIEGLAGSGKTTLIKYILSRWIDIANDIKGLDQFDLIIYLQCNNAYINSLHDLIVSLMPETARRFDKEKLVQSILCKRLLVVVDGVDEAHAGTRTVLKELLNKTQSRLVKFLCTSRPEKMQWLYRIKGELKCGTYSIIGIPHENREIFIQKLHKYYVTTLNKEKASSTNLVIETLNKLPPAIKMELKLPIFLALFTYFCTIQPKKVACLNSVFGLYNELTNALKEKLCTRSMTKNDDSRDEEEIKEEIDKCFSILCQQSFVSLTEDSGNVPWTSFQSIRDKSSYLGLSVKEVLSAFLVVKMVLTPRGIEEVVGFPHKGLQEFLAAKSIIECLKDGASLYDIFDIKETGHRESITTKTMRALDLNTSFMKYQNLLTHLAGLVSIENMMTDKIVNEIVSLYKKAGIYLPRQWLSLLAALKNHALVSEYILMRFKKLDINDSQLDAFIGLLKCGCPSEVIIRIKSPSSSNLKIKSALSRMSNFDCNVKLLLRQHFMHPSNYSSCNLLNVFGDKNVRCCFTWFEGNLTETELRNLPLTIQVLRLGIGSPNQAKSLHLLNGKRQIYFLKIHIPREIRVEDVPNLNVSANDFILYLSGVQNRKEDITWAVDITKKLNSNKKFREIIFARSHFNKYAFIEILKLFQKGGISVTKSLTVSSSEIEAAEETVIAKKCNSIIGCKFNLAEESEIWPL